MKSIGTIFSPGEPIPKSTARISGHYSIIREIKRGEVTELSRQSSRKKKHYAKRSAVFCKTGESPAS